MDQFKGKKPLDSKERISIGGSSPSGSQAEKQGVASEVALSSNSIGEMSGVLNKNVDEAKDISCSSEETKFRKDMDALETRPPLKMGPLDSVADNSVCSFSGVEMPTSGASIEAQPASDADLKVQHNKVYAHDSSETHAKLRELEVDYDSQYEDGEVRESIFHAWEEYDGEDMDVDYGSDNASNMGYEAQNIMKNTQESNFQPSLSGSSVSVKERPLKGKDGWNEVASGDETVPYKVIRGCRCCCP
ncbi:hypothetical protein Dsin_007690 [Dipteronia sinensis]|uniref:Uncharacterized protein n=1 Tax=Dipteronia sinensis TaxID=43782 RepID=A0AAE0EGQ3_9ROSI|nr:hypothetical protein Dsin_007690 [Dipteronia sinensis]